MPTTQFINQPRNNLVGVDYVSRNESNYAWQGAVSSILALPALRAFWAMSSVDYATASRARDIAGGSYHLSDNNTPLFGYDQLAPYVEFDGVNQYLSRADGGAANWADIIGTETYIESAQQGLTIGGWFYFEAAAALSEFMSGKYNFGVNQRSYGLYRLGTGMPRFAVSTDGTAVVSIDGTVAMSVDTWQFVVGRFVPSTTLTLWINNTVYTLAAGVPATLHDGTASFTVGAFGNPANYMEGKASLCWLSAAALSDSLVTALFNRTRKLYNV